MQVYYEIIFNMGYTKITKSDKICKFEKYTVRSTRLSVLCKYIFQSIFENIDSRNLQSILIWYLKIYIALTYKIFEYDFWKYIHGYKVFEYNF
jgi:hypothetical protein